MNDIGNESSMRGALERIHFHLSQYVARKITDTSLCLRIKNEINAALKEPARNCDVYKTKEDAEKAFMSEPCDEPCGNCTIKDINNECGVKWLFAKYNKEDK